MRFLLRTVSPPRGAVPCCCWLSQHPLGTRRLSAEVFPQDLFLVLSNQDQLAPHARLSVSAFHLGLAVGFSGPRKRRRP